MAERASVNQSIQLGVEATSGTPVAGNRKLQTMSFDAHVQTGIDQFRPMGFKFPTIDALNREWTSVAMRGSPTYAEIVYPLGSVFSQPTITQLLDGATPTGMYRWVFDTNSNGPDNPYTFTIEQGDKFAASGIRAHKYSYAIFHEFGLTFSRERVEQRGNIIAQKFTDNIVMTAGATALPLVPIIGSSWDVFLDSTFGALGTTKLGRIFSVNFNFNNKQNPLWVLDSAQASWVTHVEAPVTLTAAVVVEADVTGMAFLSALRNNNNTQFIRLRSTGPLGYNGGLTVANSATIDMAVKVGAVEAFNDNQGVYAIGFRLDSVHDAGWGKAVHAEVVNSIASA